MASIAGDGRGRQGRARAIAPCLWIAALAACEDPRVDARVAWVDQVHEDGSRTVHFYDRGALREATLQPTESSRDPEAQVIIVEVAPADGGALVLTDAANALQGAGRRWLQAGYLDFAGRRALPLRLPLTGFAPPSPIFAGLGDALAWVEPCADRLALVPLDPRHALPIRDEAEGRWIEPLGADLGAPVVADLCPLRSGIVGARAAPVLFTIAGGGFEDALAPTAGAEVIAFRYPSGEAGAGAAPALVELGRAALDPAIPVARRSGCVGPHGCLGLASPGGEALSVLGAEGATCAIQRWVWGDEDQPAPICAWKGAGTVLAAISDRHYVIVDGDRVRRVDWESGDEAALPLLGDGWFWGASADGSAVILVSTRGPMLRVGVDGLELVNVENTTCTVGQPPVIAPGGRWAAWTCASAAPDGLGGVDGVIDPATEPRTTVVRAGVGGLERYDGVAMWAVAIDDQGELLLYSRGNAAINSDLWQPASSPRTLYVLGSGGELSRVSTLEPDPELSRGVRGDFRWMATAQ